MTACEVRRRWMWRKPLAPPPWHALGERERKVFDAADDAIADGARQAEVLPHAGLEGVLPAPLELVPGLHHPLLASFPPPPPSTALSRARAERRAALTLVRERDRADPGPPVADLVRAAARHLVGREAFRSDQIATDCDSSGRHVVFPGPEQIGPQFARLDRFLVRTRGLPRSFRAAVAMAMVLNCHALSDGNGRTSRLLFNLIAHPDVALGGYYLPLYEIGLLSRGGFIVRLRQAELRGDWAPLADFTLAAAIFWRLHLTAATVGNASNEGTRRRPDGQAADGSA